MLWKQLTSSKRYTLAIDTVTDDILQSHYCSFCELTLKVCRCFTDIVLAFEKRKKQIAHKIAQPIFDRANDVL